MSTNIVGKQCLIQDKIFTSPPRAVVSRGRRAARSSHSPVVELGDIIIQRY